MHPTPEAPVLVPEARGRGLTMAVSRQEAVSSLSELLREAEKVGISLEDILKCLDSEDGSAHSTGVSHSRWRSRCSIWKWFRFTVLNILPVLFIAFLLYFPVVQLTKESPCVLYSPMLFAEVMHPIVNCSMCEGLTEAPRLTNLSRREFMEHHAHSSKPIVAVGAASHWPAIDVFSYNYFKGLYQSHPEAIEADMNTGQFFSYSSSIENLKELFELSSESAAMETERWYIGWSTSDPHIGQEIKSHISTPEFLPPSSTENQLAWIFMGAPGPGASMHIDSVGEPSWQAQLSGTKTWTLTPPAECDTVCSSFNVTVHRGDIIVVDTNRWYHQTFIHPGNISITIGSEYR